MFYYLFYKQLIAYAHFFNVFYYITFRAMAAAATGFLLSMIFSHYFIPFLKKQQIGQTIREDGPKRHLQKAGTPTIGGVIIWFGFVISVLLWARLDINWVWIILFAAISFAFIGFLDDFLKIKRGKGNGLKAKTKFYLQIFFASIVSILIYVVYSRYSDCPGCFYMPFFKNLVFNMGFFYILFSIFVVVGASNAVNLTDGLDGLATGPSLTVIFTLAIFAYVSGNLVLASYLKLPYVFGSGEITVILSALFGSCLAFLWYNCYPAEVFMGDTGSLALGAIFGVIAIIIKEEVVLVIAGGIFVIETISVILQVASFKTTGERIFKMAPIHHHFELKNWPESKVIIRFWIISILLSLVALTALKLR